MDLRRRLLARLSLLLGGLLLFAMAIQISSLRGDIDAEIAASTRLVDIFLAAGVRDVDLPPDERMLRHVRIRSANETAATPTPSPWSAWLGWNPEALHERAIRVGDQLLFIAPNPESEISERLGDTVRLLITLLLYSGATLLVAWWVTDRALQPVRQLESGLHRLASGQDDPALPQFALREFSRVAGAISHLASALRESRAAQHALARQLIAVQEDERRALAGELHDELGQTLTALNVTTAHLCRPAVQQDAGAVSECANDLRRDLRTCAGQLRKLLHTLRPHGLDASGLRQALSELIDGWRNRETGIEFAVGFPESLPPIDDACALVLYRTVQEALTNVVRHSGAQHCRISLSASDAGLELCIEDDGCGLPQAGPAQRGGLLGMAERLEMIGSTLQLQDNPPRGLRLKAHIPLQQGHED